MRGDDHLRREQLDGGLQSQLHGERRWCHVVSAAGNAVGVGLLQNNSSPTQSAPTHTHALLPGSPALDAGDPGGCRDQNGALLLTDQRGFPRSSDGNNDGVARCDIGAYESFTGSATSVVAALLPSSRSIQLGTTATAFATIIKLGQAVAAACSMAPLTSVPAAFQYQ